MLLAVVAGVAWLPLAPAAASDAEENTVLATIPVESSPWGLAVDETNGRVWVAHRRYGTGVSLIEEDRVAARVDTGFLTLPFAVAVDPVADRVYVTDQYGSKVHAIDGSAAARTGTSPRLDGGVWGVAANSETGRVYVTNPAAGTLTVLDGESLQPVAVVPVGAGPKGVAVDSLANRIYVTNSGYFYIRNGIERTVSVVDGATNAVVGTITVEDGPAAVAVDPAHGLVYVANKDAHPGTVSVIDAEHGELVTSVVVGDNPAGVAVDPRTRYVYASLQTESEVAVVDARTNAYAGTLPTGSSPTPVAVDPLAQRAYVANVTSATVSVLGAPAFELVRRHRPIFVLGEGELCPADPNDPSKRAFGPQTYDPYDPTSVDTVLAPNDTRLFDRDLIFDDDVLDGRAPTAADLWDAAPDGDEAYIDVLVGVEPSDDRETCFAYAERWATAAGRETTTYVHVDDDYASGGVVRVTYWLFYLYDDFKNQHEGDWENVMLTFESWDGCAFSSVAELVAAGCTPAYATYSGHYCESSRTWDFVDREGRRPIDYVGRGSHANLFAPGRHLVRICQYYLDKLAPVPGDEDLIPGDGGLRGAVIGWDYGPYDPEGSYLPGPDDPALSENVGRRVSDYELILLPCDDLVMRDDPFAWTRYRGRWGQDFVDPRGKQGPTVSVCESPSA